MLFLKYFPALILCVLSSVEEVDVDVEEKNSEIFSATNTSS